MNFLKEALTYNLGSKYIKKHNPNQRANFLGRLFKNKAKINKLKK